MVDLARLRLWGPSRKHSGGKKKKPPTPPRHHGTPPAAVNVRTTKKPRATKQKKALLAKTRPRAPAPSPRRTSRQHQRHHEQSQQRQAPTPMPVVRQATRNMSPPSVSSFNTADYSELFGTQVSDWAGVTAMPKPGRAVRRGSTRESVRPSGLGGGTHGGEPDLVVIDGGQVGNTGNDRFDTDALYAAMHHYTRIGVRSVAVVPWWAFETSLSFSDKARLRTDMLRGRIMASPPTSRHDLFVRDVSRRFRAYVVSNGHVPADLSSRCIRFSPQHASFRPRNGPGVENMRR